MRKRTIVVHLSVVMALCAVGFVTPAAADEGPNATPTPRPGAAPFAPSTVAPPDAFLEYSRTIVTTQKATSDVLVAPAADSTSAPVTPAPVPARAAPQGRSYPRT